MSKQPHTQTVPHHTVRWITRKSPGFNDIISRAPMGGGVISSDWLALRASQGVLTSLVSSFLTAVLLVLCRARSRLCSSLRCHCGMGVLSTAWETQHRVKVHRGSTQEAGTRAVPGSVHSLIHKLFGCLQIIFPLLIITHLFKLYNGWIVRGVASLTDRSSYLHLRGRQPPWKSTGRCPGRRGRSVQVWLTASRRPEIKCAPPPEPESTEC